MHKGSFSCHILFYILFFFSWFLDDSHSDWGKVLSQNSFNLDFPGDLEHYKNSYWPFVFLFFLWEPSVQFIGPFAVDSFIPSVSNFCNSLSMLTVCPWPEMQLVKLWSLLTCALLTLPAVFCAVLRLCLRAVHRSVLGLVPLLLVFCFNTPCLPHNLVFEKFPKSFMVWGLKLRFLIHFKLMVYKVRDTNLILFFCR